jgi:hypothetical protein
MGVFGGGIWVVQAIFGALRPVEISYEGYKMGTKFVVCIVN